VGDFDFDKPEKQPENTDLRNWACNTVSQRRRSAQALLTLASPPAQVVQALFPRA
jgi:hypothetical protein